ncbi:protein I2 [BeAn 58058 virus]|uniref:protein I2 n=1 Tax=BeAn 58058 virus TaxID=67082 RepID=UPI0009098371|nr:protein I2 [BeAn 58058 virus]APG58257.1 protein I2 [BeAn 58058 virus]
MDRLYAAIFGVFMSSTDDEFSKFIEVVKSVLSDENGGSKNKQQKSFFNFNILLGLIIFILLILFIVIFYLKVVRMT